MFFAYFDLIESRLINEAMNSNSKNKNKLFSVHFKHLDNYKRKSNCLGKKITSTEC